jgi:eukaryotic-like serine/threonine-protein kinase
MDHDAPHAAAAARVGRVLRDKWRLDRLLGVGGMASVYAATHRNGMRGAVKIMHAELAARSSARERFLREGYVANRVGHPGCVRVLDDDVTDEGCVFLVMELLEGEPLEQMAQRAPDRRLPPGLVLRMTDQLLDALAAAHEQGVVHRDLKPDNLFLTVGGVLKILDFGIAKLRQMPSANATATGLAMGTPAFMPPEQALGQWDAVDAQSDLWAVGATLWTLLTGGYVHEADTAAKVLLASMTRPPAPLALVAPWLPPVITALVDRALRFEKTERWPSARAMQAATREALAWYEAQRPAPIQAEASGGGATTSTTAASATAASAAPVARNDTTVVPGRGRARLVVALLAVGIGAAASAALLFRGEGAPIAPASATVSASASDDAPADAPDTAVAAAPPPDPDPTASSTAEPSARRRPTPSAQPPAPPPPPATAKPKNLLERRK